MHIFNTMVRDVTSAVLFIFISVVVIMIAIKLIMKKDYVPEKTREDFNNSSNKIENTYNVSMRISDGIYKAQVKASDGIEAVATVLSGTDIDTYTDITDITCECTDCTCSDN